MADSLEVVSVTTIKPDIFKSPSEMPVDKLADRIRISKQYILDGIERDCRMAQDFLDEWRGKELYKHFSKTWEEFCSEYFERPAEWLDHIADGLKLLDTTKPIPASKAVETAIELKATSAPDTPRQPSGETFQRAETAKQLREQGQTLEAIGKHLGCSRAYVHRLLRMPSELPELPEQVKPIRPKRGNSKEYRQARLKRDNPELAAQVEAGQISAYQGAKQAGLVKGKAFNVTPKSDPVLIAQRLMAIDPELAVSVAIEIQNLHIESA